MRGAGLRRLLAGLLLLLAAGGAGPDGASGFDRFEQSAAREMQAHPGWYSFGDGRAVLVSREGLRRGVIWGTLHADYDRDTEPPPAILKLFADATSLAVEFDPARVTPEMLRTRSRRAREAEVRHDPAALARLDPQTRAELDALDLPPDVLARVSLLGLARAVAARGPWAAPAAPSPDDMVDNLLVRFARDRGKPVHGLDDGLDPLDVVYGADPNGPEAALQLRRVLVCPRDAGPLREWFRDAYARGRIAAAFAGAATFCTEPWHAPVLARYRARLLTERNAAMAARLDAVLSRPGFHFVAIGAGHLLGEDGVPALLRARGWTVTPCPGDRC